MTTEQPGASPALSDQLGVAPKRYALDVQCLYTDETKTLMSKGHQDPAE